MITGIDLVKEQVKIAEGKKLLFHQKDLVIRGHAIEARVYAEDPENEFLPDTGILDHYQVPKGPGVRVDDGYYQGMEIPIHYDPMIAKLIVHASNRQEAMARMVRAIDEYRIIGIKTTLDFCKFVMMHPAFKSGDYHTGFIPTYFKPGESSPDDQEARTIAAAFAAYTTGQIKKSIKDSNRISAPSNWRSRANDI